MQSLQNHFLIATSALKDGYFERSVTYICEHNEDGAMGLVINQPLEISVPELLKKIEIPTEDKVFEKRAPVYAGGPLSTEKGFVLHRTELGWRQSVNLSKNIMLTTSKDILEQMGTDLGPKDYLLTLGYAGWSAGQLEEELKENAWLTLAANEAIMFDTPIHMRWEAATALLGFNPWQLTSEIGHA
ncbi:YqgE/AlgH family protein [Catenovulum sp. SM1970]|uniref:YqgE/AlgH family protein n=1 Tax=Marinifaba aquimaris TaxID=2741323 RepID=UPI00157381FE|nr:YqgE/AlgH family protein [Marinifaba aquimaris]NTS77836.1 YqgE/AlgH family protein [Marinifaba aquimaris]